MNKLRYFINSLKKSLRQEGYACPSCGKPGNAPIDRKWLVTSLRRCSGCMLLYRTPTTSEAENETFYQSTYRQGFTTELPSKEELKRLVGSNFSGHEKDYGPYVNVLKALKVPAGSRLFDFGCSWGYGSYQLARAGFQVDAYDISRPRADYARSELQVSIKDLNEVEPHGYDVFFSAHVIEHVPSVSRMIDFGLRCLRPGGLFVAFTPNGSQTFRAGSPKNWHKLWGLNHPQLIDDTFVRARFADTPLVLASCPHPTQQIERWTRRDTLIADLSGVELLLAVVSRA
jgi:2-polyprenyl-3-methyl-5-hydroxy-6-metoxy-1,4-benzoquinol methylase